MEGLFGCGSAERGWFLPQECGQSPWAAGITLRCSLCLFVYLFISLYSFVSWGPDKFQLATSDQLPFFPLLSTILVHTYPSTHSISWHTFSLLSRLSHL